MSDDARATSAEEHDRMEAGTPIHVVVINGSPRKDGNSTTLAEAVAAGAVAAGAVALPTVHLEQLRFRGCQNCGGCDHSGACVLQDDLAPVYTALMCARFWVFASPIYFDTISGQLKLFYDRLFCFTKRKLKQPRTAVFAIAYEAGRNDGYTTNMGVYQSYLKWFGEFSQSEVIAAANMARKGDINKCPDLLDAARALGARLAAQCAHAR